LSIRNQKTRMILHRWKLTMENYWVSYPELPKDQEKRV
jgi:hypothetical protein